MLQHYSRDWIIASAILKVSRSAKLVRMVGICQHSTRMGKRTVTTAGLWLRKLVDRPLTHNELHLLKETVTSKPKFIEIFKTDRMEAFGRNISVPPSLYEMVLL